MNQSNCAVLETESQSEGAGKSSGFSFLSRAAQISAAQVIRRSTRFLFLFLAARE